MLPDSSADVTGVNASRFTIDFADERSSRRAQRKWDSGNVYQ